CDPSFVWLFSPSSALPFPLPCRTLPLPPPFDRLPRRPRPSHPRIGFLYWYRAGGRPATESIELDPSDPIRSSMGRLLLASLPATGAVIYRCKHCGTHLAYATDIISRMFCCKNGKAYLLDKMVNVNDGEKDDRMMTTGMHTVCDIFCVACGSMVGWKYLAAVEKTQRYKVGKFLLDRAEVLAAVAGGAGTTVTSSSGDEDDDPQPSDEDSD
ncbi:unnamed protein product, partial [Urochloa humidicola]